MFKKFNEEDLKREIEAEFADLIKQARAIEEAFENGIQEIRTNDINEIKREELEELLGNIREFQGHYLEFKDTIFEVAGVVGDTPEGKQVLDTLDTITKDLTDLERVLEELIGLVKPTANNATIEKLKREFILQYNEKIASLRTFFMEKIYDILDKLKEALEKEETYYG